MTQHKNKLPRARCPFCRTIHPLTVSYKLRQHQPNKPKQTNTNNVCKGSGFQMSKPNGWSGTSKEVLNRLYGKLVEASQNALQ